MARLRRGYGGQAPRLALWILRLRLSAEDREFAIGDLEEEFLDRIERDGRDLARRWYWRQALRSLITRQPRRYPQPLTSPRRPAMNHFSMDMRFALRLLRRSPGFTAVVVLSLALGIGASTAMFTVVHAALLKPLPFKDPDRIVAAMYGPTAAESYPLSYPQFLQWRDEFKVFDDIAAYFNWSVTIGGADEPEKIRAMRGSGSLFSTLGVEPIVGRLFTKAHEPREAERVVLLGESFWRRKYNADPNIQGRRIIINDVPFTIIGVLPGWFQRVMPRDDGWELFAPLRLSPETAPASLNFLSVVARLKPAQNAAVAHEQLQAAVLRANPDVLPQPRVVVQPLRERIVMNSRVVLLALLGAVGFLLLITCANLANLLLARSISRQREIAVRLAVGAGRRRIVTQLLTECLVLAGAGCAAGVFAAWTAVRAAASLPILTEAGVYELTLNWTVVGFAVALSTVVAVMFGIVPALRAGRANVAVDLRDGARVTGGDRLRSTFVVAEVALTVVLLTGAALLGRSFAKLMDVDKGFETDSVFTFGLATSPVKHRTAAAQVLFFESVLDRIRRIPGVASAGVVSDLPLTGSGTNGGVIIEGRTFAPGETPFAHKRIVSAGYFDALQIPIRQGRVFNSTDDSRAPAVMVISEAFAKRWFPGENPLGKRVGFNWDMEGFQTVVGVVANVKQRGLDDPENPAVYVALPQRAESSFTVVVRTTVPPESIVQAARDEVRAVDPSRPFSDVRTMNALMSESVSGRRLSLDIVGAFALIGLLLAATGIYGVVSHAAQQRTREFGIRLALGAESTSVLALVFKQGLLLAILGASLGLAGALALGGVLRAQLFGVEPSDPATLAAVCVALVLVALVACYLPARRAVKVNPASILREG
jgi:putative ABC transport system permease protein